MNEVTTIKEAIRSVIPDMNNYSVICTVSDIDLVKCICNCTPKDGGAVLVNVRINASDKDGFKLIPKNNTDVVVTLINNTTGYVSMVSEVDEIHLNGVTFGGIVKIVEQTAKLNQLVSELQAQLVLISTGITTAGGSYTPATLSTFNKTDYENTTVKQGNGS